MGVADGPAAVRVARVRAVRRRGPLDPRRHGGGARDDRGVDRRGSERAAATRLTRGRKATRPDRGHAGRMSVWFGLHCPSYTFPDLAAGAAVRPRRRAGPGRGGRAGSASSPSWTTSTRSRASGSQTSRCSRRGPPSPRSPARRPGSGSGRSSPASRTATRRCSRRRRRRSTCCRAGARSSGSAPPGTRPSTTRSGSRSRRSSERMDRLDEALTIARGDVRRGALDVQRPRYTRRAT